MFVGDSDVESDGDDDACVKISLVTPLRSAAVILSLGNQGWSSTAPAAEGPNTRDSRGKGIMADVAIAPSVVFFPFFDGPYYATYFEDGVARKCEFTQEEWDAPYRPTFGVLTKEVFKDPAVCRSIVDQFPTSGVMVRVESLSDDQLTAKMSVLHCMMMSHDEKVASLTGLELQVSTLKKQVFGLNDKLASSNDSFAKSKSKGNERKKKIKSLTKSLDNLHAKVARVSAALNQAIVLEAEKDEEILYASAGFERGLSMHRTKDEFAVVILQLEPEKLARSANVPTLRDAYVSPPTKESTVTPASKSLELSANVNFTASVVAPEHNEEMVNAEVDRSDPKMTDDITFVKFGHTFMQGISVALDDDVELVEVWLGRVSSGPNDVVVSLFAGEKGDGLVPSLATGEEAAANSSRV
ncbi:hypothetical protein Tco_1118533 [Tanacetum coccineum]